MVPRGGRCDIEVPVPGRCHTG